MIWWRNPCRDRTLQPLDSQMIFSKVRHTHCKTHPGQKCTQLNCRPLHTIVLNRPLIRYLTLYYTIVNWVTLAWTGIHSRAMWPPKKNNNNKEDNFDDQKCQLHNWELSLPHAHFNVQHFDVYTYFSGTLFLSRAPVPSSDIVTCPQGWRTVEQLREENGEKLAYERLKSVFHCVASCW